MGGPGVARNRFSPPAASGGGGGGSLDVQEDGILITPAATFINFVGPYLAVTPNGLGADVEVLGGGGLDHQQIHVFTPAEIAAKQWIMGAVNTGQPVFAFIEGASPLITFIDFTVTGNVFDWNGLGMDGIVNAGDRIQVQW